MNVPTNHDETALERYRREQAEEEAWNRRQEKDACDNEDEG